MENFNSVKMVGRIVEKPIIRTNKNNVTWATFSLCVQRSAPSKTVDFFNVIVWEEKVDEIKDLDKQDLVVVEGSIHKKSFKGNDGNRRYSIQINAKSIKKLEEEELSFNEALMPQEEVLLGA